MRLRPATLRPPAIATLTGLSVKQFGVLLERLWARRPAGGRGRDRGVVAVGTARPGNRNDVTVFRETLAATVAATGHRRLAGDGGYRGAPGVASPRRGPGQFIIRDRAWRRFVRRRAVIEHLL